MNLLGAFGKARGHKNSSVVAVVLLLARHAECSVRTVRHTSRRRTLPSNTGQVTLTGVPIALLLNWLNVLSCIHTILVCVIDHTVTHFASHRCLMSSGKRKACAGAPRWRISSCRPCVADSLLAGTHSTTLPC